MWAPGARSRVLPRSAGFACAMLMLAAAHEQSSSHAWRTPSSSAPQLRERNALRPALGRRPAPAAPEGGRARPAALMAATPLSEAVPAATAPPPHRRLVALLFALCASFSLLTDMLTRQILQRHERPGMAITVTFFHFFVSAASGAAALPLGERLRTRAARAKRGAAPPPPPPPPRAASKAPPPSARQLLRLVWPLALLQLGGFLATNLSLKFAAVSFSHTVKACECLFTALFVFVLLGQTLSWKAYAALVPTAGGVSEQWEQSAG